MRELSGVMSYILIGGCTQIYGFVKTHRTVHLKFVYFTVGKFYFKKIINMGIPWWSSG